MTVFKKQEDRRIRVSLSTVSRASSSLIHTKKINPNNPVINLYIPQANVRVHNLIPLILIKCQQTRHRLVILSINTVSLF